MVANNGRAEYFRERRKSLMRITAEVPKENLEMLDKKLKKIGKSRKAWINEKINEEIGKKE